MKKVLISMLVLSAVEATAAGAEAGIWYPPNVNASCDNVLLTASAVTVFEIQGDAGPAYILCLENPAQPSDKMTDGVKYTMITSLLPEPMAIAVLGLAGLLFHRPRIVRSVA